MKKLFLLALTCLTLSLGFTACDDDDDDFEVTGSSTENLEPVDFNLQTDLNGYFNGTMGITAYSGDLSTGGGPFYTEERTLTFTPNSDGTVDIDFGQFKVSVVLFVTHMKSLVYEKCAVEQTNDGCQYTGSAIISEEDADYESILKGTFNKRTNSVSLTVTILSGNPTNGAQSLGDDWTITFDGEYATEAIPQTSDYNGPTFTGTLATVYNGAETVTETPVYTQLKDDGSIDYFVIENLVLIGGSQNISFDDVKVENLVFDENGYFEGSLTVYLWGTMPLTASLTGNINDVEKTLSIVSEEAVYSDLDNTTVSFTFDGETGDAFEFVMSAGTNVTFTGKMTVNVSGSELEVETSIIGNMNDAGVYTGFTISELSISVSLLGDISIYNIPISISELKDDGSFTGQAYIYYSGIADDYVDVEGKVDGNTLTMTSDDLTVMTVIKLSFTFEGTTDDIVESGTLATAEQIKEVVGEYTGTVTASAAGVDADSVEAKFTINASEEEGKIDIYFDELAISTFTFTDVTFTGELMAMSDGTYSYTATGDVNLKDVLGLDYTAPLTATGTFSDNNFTLLIDEKVMGLVDVYVNLEASK